MQKIQNQSRQQNLTLVHFLEILRSSPLATVGALILNPFYMRTLNKVMLMGNLASDPEVRTTTTGKKVVQFVLVTNRGRRPSPETGSGEKGEKKSVSADFHRVIAWEGLGGICEKFLKKGDPVYVEGRIENHSYEDKDNKRHYVTEMIARDINLIEMRRNKSGQQVVLKEDETEGVEEREAVAA